MHDRRDRRRLEELFLVHHADLLGYAVRRLDQPADAADALAEVFLVAWRRINEVPAGGEARLWLFGVARHVVANMRRGEWRRQRLGTRLRSHLATVVPPVEALDGAAVADVRAALERLSDDDRELLTLVVWEDFTPAEAAGLLGLTAGTTRVRLHRARTRLRHLLAEDDGPAGAAVDDRETLAGSRTCSSWTGDRPSGPEEN